MLILGNVSLKKYNSFGLDYRAKQLIVFRTESEAASLLARKIKIPKPLLVLGGGSNLLFTKDFEGTIFFPSFRGIRVEKKKGDEVIISAAAGELWDRLVEWSVEKGFWGLENLSYIPGKTGAVPVQNIGAYGAEVKNSILKVRALSISDGTVREFSNEECQFGYRSSIFKHKLKGSYLITRVYFRLKLTPDPNLSYGTLKEEVLSSGDPTLKSIREAVIRIRKCKFPDPEITGNAGSFFKNPLTDNHTVEKLKKEYPGIPYYPDSQGYSKLAAGWLIEKCGWKGCRYNDAGVHDKQALVIINHGNASGMELYDLSERIRQSVIEKFSISLEREVEVI